MPKPTEATKGSVLHFELFGAHLGAMLLSSCFGASEACASCFWQRLGFFGWLRKTLMLECYNATRMKISRAFLGSVRHVCYHSNIFHEYSPGPHFNIDPSCPTDRSKWIDRYVQQPVPVALHPLASRSAEPEVDKTFQLTVNRDSQTSIYSKSAWTPICQSPETPRDLVQRMFLQTLQNLLPNGGRPIAFTSGPNSGWNVSPCNPMMQYPDSQEFPFFPQVRYPF